MDEDQAAKTIQQAWRRRSTLKSQLLDAHVRWQDALSQVALNQQRSAQENGLNSPRQRWRRAGLFARQLQQDPNSNILNDYSVQAPGATTKTLQEQHFLEQIDGSWVYIFDRTIADFWHFYSKHRYGSNLKACAAPNSPLEFLLTILQWYHREWAKANTTDNFFRWLDHGAGKEISLDACPRDRLEAERITYLSAEQRLNYLVEIDKEGKLRWAKNQQLVDTSAGQWKDSTDGSGIVPDDTPAILQDDESIGQTSEDQDAAATHYAGDKTQTGFFNTMKRNLTTRGMLDRLLRKTLRRNTWIYVSDKNFNIFIGIKVTGTFQHSSFLSGGLVTSAGLISVKDGVIHTLSPLSGHYRTSVGHFHQFIDKLNERGADMHKARISKAEAALWGIEHIGKWKKKQSEITNKIGSGVHKMVDSLPKPEDTGWKAHILYGRPSKAKDGTE